MSKIRSFPLLQSISYRHIFLILFIYPLFFPLFFPYEIYAGSTSVLVRERSHSSRPEFSTRLYEASESWTAGPPSLGYKKFSVRTWETIVEPSSSDLRRSAFVEAAREIRPEGWADEKDEDDYWLERRVPCSTSRANSGGEPATSPVFFFFLVSIVLDIFSIETIGFVENEERQEKIHFTPWKISRG